MALLVALAVGWLWGTSDRWELDRAVHEAELRQCVLEAHSSVLSARLDVDRGNFRDAARHLEDARRLLQRSREKFEGLGFEEGMPHWNWALAQIDEAQRLAHQLEYEGLRVVSPPSPGNTNEPTSVQILP